MKKKGKEMGLTIKGENNDISEICKGQLGTFNELKVYDYLILHYLIFSPQGKPRFLNSICEKQQAKVVEFTLETTFSNNYPIFLLRKGTKFVPKISLKKRLAFDIKNFTK
jgi:hypothetical protein